jgi:hypothetical protein
MPGRTGAARAKDRNDPPALSIHAPAKEATIDPTAIISPQSTRAAKWRRKVGSGIPGSLRVDCRFDGNATKPFFSDNSVSGEAN